ncbi:MAG: hypothetical protein QM778_06580 [Myxococcales bacterium]
MTDRVATATTELSAPEETWARISSVLAGSLRPPVEVAAVKLAAQIAATPCDVEIRAGSFELWHAARSHHERHDFSSAGQVLQQLMRLAGLSRVTEPCVAVIERAGLGMPFPELSWRALWIVPASDRVDVIVREVTRLHGAQAGVPMPAVGVWQVPEACPRNERKYVAAAFPCPLCHVQPLQFLQLPEDGAFQCPACGEAFVPRISRF